MFDKLVASEPAGTDAKNRRNYFMVSTVIVSSLFLGMVVVSIFADDFDLGHQAFEIETMLAPVEVSPDKPEPPRPQRQSSAPSDQQASVPMRTMNMASVDEPNFVSNAISTTPNSVPSRPAGPFAIGPMNVDPPGGGTPSRTDGTGPVENSFVTKRVEKVDDEEDETIGEPPPVRTPRVKTGGVLNGQATSLPQPAYTAAAKAVGAKGRVNVQITVDESGKVIFAQAVDGHPLLRPEAVKAAYRARFTPTKLSNVPVKVTGVIVYNFIL